MNRATRRGEQRAATGPIGIGDSVKGHIVIERGGFHLDVELSVRHGEIAAVMGPSGAGKSTLLSALAGVLRLSDGHISIGNDEITRRRHLPPQRRGVVLLGQHPNLFPHLTVRDNVAFGLQARGMKRQQARAEADEWLWKVGVSGSGDHRPSELSGGQQQRVAVARALAAIPRVLLLDEPLTSLDTETAADIRAMLREQLAAAHMTTVLVTHDAFDAAALAKTLEVIEEGRVTQSGAVREVLANPGTRFIAAAAGLNRLPGMAEDGRWRGRGIGPDLRLEGSEPLDAADGTALMAVFRPADVQLVPSEEETWTGALRVAQIEPLACGEWLARVTRLEPTPGGARVHTSEPDVAVDVPTAQVAAIRLAVGDPVRLFVAPQDVRLIPAS